MSPTVLIVRDDERRALDELMRRKRNILIVGDEGVGKSAILENAISAGAVKNILYSKHSTTLKETLVNLVGSVVGVKGLQKKNILTLKKSCYRLLEVNPEYVVLDHVAWVEPKFYAFLTYMKERNIPFIIATRKPDKNNVGHLWMGLYDYATMDIKNLDPTKTGRLVDHYATSFHLKIAAESDFKKDIFKISKGNPKVIKDLCQLARDEKYRLNGYVDVRLMELDRKIHNVIR
jgi:hypothetical protein